MTELHYRFQLKKMLQEKEGKQSDTAESRELTAAWYLKTWRALLEAQTRQRGKDESSLSPFLPFYLSLLIGDIKVCLYAHGNDPVERKKLMRQNKGEILKRCGRGAGIWCKNKGSGCRWEPKCMSTDSEGLQGAVELLFRLFLLS